MLNQKQNSSTFILGRKCSDTSPPYLDISDNEACDCLHLIAGVLSTQRHSIGGDQTQQARREVIRREMV